MRNDDLSIVKNTVPINKPYFYFLIFRYLRAIAYRWIVRWIFGMLGWENSRPLPACLYNDIRKRYPSQSTTGYKSTQQRT